MNGSVQRLHCKYRLIGDAPSPASVRARLDQVVRVRVAEALSEALDRALGDDPAIYIVRNVTVRLVLRNDGDTSDAEIARRWGTALASALAKEIATGRAVVRFADQADYVSQFVSDLMTGTAWQRWLYDAFASLRELPRAQALRRVLIDNTEHLPAVLASLERRGALSLVLAELDDAAMQTIWADGLGGAAVPPAIEIRPLFIAAMRIVDALDLWATPQHPVDTLFAAYMTTRPSLPDWQSATSLTGVVLDVLSFLRRRQLIAGASDLRDRVDRLAAFDWLDVPRLRDGLMRWDLDGLRDSFISAVTVADRTGTWAGPRLADETLFRGWIEAGESYAVEVEHVLRYLERIGWARQPASSPLSQTGTPRQQEVIGEIVRLLRSGVSLGAGQAGALRIYAALIARRPSWAGNALVVGLIDTIRAAAAALGRTTRQDAAVTALLDGDVDGVVATLTDPVREAAVIRAIATLGQPALTAAALMTSARDATGQAIATECAGVFLLVRAVMDTRVVTTGRAASPVLAALATRWGGATAVVDGRLDPALTLLAGYNKPPTPDELAAQLMHHDLDRLRSDLVRTLTGQRLSHAELADIPVEGHAHVDHNIDMIATAVLRHWARWLRRFSDSSTPFLLGEMIRRPGRVLTDARGIAVELARRPLDLVLDMAGYLAEIESVPWLGGRRVRFVEPRTS